MTIYHEFGRSTLYQHIIEKTGMEHPTFIVIKNFFYIKDIDSLIIYGCR